MADQQELQYAVDEHNAHNECHDDVQQNTHDSGPKTTDAFDLRRLERDPDPMQYTDELRLRNQIFRMFNARLVVYRHPYLT